jgi:hypothetical protein
MVPKRIPRQFRHQTVILMEIVTVVRKYQIRRKIGFYLLEALLDFRSTIGKKAIAQTVYDNRPIGDIFQKRSGAFPGFLLAPLVGAKDNPTNRQLAVQARQTQDSATATDLNVVTVRAQAEKAERSSTIEG